MAEVATTTQNTPIQAVDRGEFERHLTNTRAHECAGFDREILFATQQLQRNDFLGQVAQRNPQSAQNAVLNVAALGITLNPSKQLAYLVPRDGQVLLDVSYRGLIRIAVLEGAIRDAKAELVYEQDEFEYHGPFQEPTHRTNPFSNRGRMVGAYCVSRLPDGGVQTEVMNRDDIHAVAQASDSFRKGKGPWKSFPGEMTKKSVVKRAAKWWQSQGSDRLHEAVRLANEDGGEGFAPATPATAAPQMPAGASAAEITQALRSRLDERLANKIDAAVVRAAQAGVWANAAQYFRENGSIGRDGDAWCYAVARMALVLAETPTGAPEASGDGQPTSAEEPAAQTAPDPEPELQPQPPLDDAPAHESV